MDIQRNHWQDIGISLPVLTKAPTKLTDCTDASTRRRREGEQLTALAQERQIVGELPRVAWFSMVIHFPFALIQVAEIGSLRHRLSIGDTQHDVVGWLVRGPANPADEKLDDVRGDDGAGRNGRTFLASKIVAL